MMIAAIIPTIISILLIVFIVFVVKQVTIMGTENRLSKTNMYTLLGDTSPKNATVFFGDSITELCSTEEIYYDYVQKSGIPVINRGISAETTETMLERIEDNITVLEPRNLVMLMGINDLSEGKEIKEIASNIEKMVILTKEKSPNTNIILQAVYPVNTNRDSFYQKFQLRNRDNTKVAKLNKEIEKIAKKHHITYLDVSEYLKDEKGMLKEEYTEDGLHPNIKGYYAVKDEIVKSLR